MMLINKIIVILGIIIIIIIIAVVVVVFLYFSILFDTIQARSNSDFDVKSAPIQFHGNNHNSQSDRWIKLKLYVESPEMFSYLGVNFQVNRSSEGIETRVNRGCTNFVIYFLLTRGLPIWLGFFF
jgi:flagellar basal body-associated protein FliL